MRESGFNESKQLTISNLVQYQKATFLCNYNIINNNGLFVFSIYTFSLAGNMFVHTPIQGANKEEYIHQIFNQIKMPTLPEIFTSVQHLSQSSSQVEKFSCYAQPFKMIELLSSFFFQSCYSRRNKFPLVKRY